MSSAHDPLLYARSFADVYDAWYGDLDDPTLAARALGRRIEAGASLLELGSGSGRLAGPLATAGFEVLGIDASLDLLRASPPGPRSVAADMVQLPLADGSVDGAFVAYNTFFNLAERSLQARCLGDVGRVVRGGGILAIEAFVAPVGATGQYGISIQAHPERPGDRLAIVTGPDPRDPDQIVGSHIELGSMIACRPWRLGYRSPAEIDALADSGGFDLMERTHGWNEVAFEPDDDRHVSWYRRR